MYSLLTSLAGVVTGLVAVAAILVAAVVALRNPHNPRWLRAEGAAQAAAFMFTVLLTTALTLGAETFDRHGFGLVGGTAATLGIIAGSIALLCWVFHVRERLRHADAGRSPFERLDHTPPSPGIDASMP